MRRDEAALRLAQLSVELLAGRLAAPALAGQLRRLAGELESPEAQRARLEAAKDERASQRDEIQRVFLCWAQETKRPGAKLTAEREAKIRARLRTYSVDQLCTAILFVARDPWFQGDNDAGRRYDELVTILANDTKVERHLERAGGVVETPIATQGPSPTRAADDAEEALLRGDTDAYLRAVSGNRKAAPG